MKPYEDFVSVIIPVYNSEKFLTEAIESVLNQTWKNIEIIAVDDGSNDKSLNVLKQYSDKITTLSQQNLGLAAALNAGLKIMKGKWFKWFSPDDILYPDSIETLITEAKKLPENTIIYSNWEMIDEKSMKLRSFSESNYNELTNFEFNVRLLDGQQINVNTALIPSSLLEKGCHISNLDDPVAIDYDFFLRAGILYGANFHLVDKILLKYRIHEGQLSHKNITDMISYLSEVRSIILSQLDKSEREKYQKSLVEYDKNKPIFKKTMETSLKILSRTIPNWVTDRLVIFYLNKIRRGR